MSATGRRMEADGVVIAESNVCERVPLSPAESMLLEPIPCEDDAQYNTFISNRVISPIGVS